MPKYKIVKIGCYAEERWNKVGDIVSMEEELAIGGLRDGCLEEVKEKKPVQKAKKK